LDRVSIIIPVFNRFEYADRAIRSVLNQTYSNWELYIVDDYSEDEYILPVDCENLPQNIVLLRNEINVGPGLSRQRGLELAIGEFVCFLDSDDYYHTKFLALMIADINANTEVSGVYCTSFDLFTGQIRKSSNKSYDKILPTLFNNHRPWATCSWLWRREFIAEWTSLRTNQDSLFEISTSFKNNKISHVREVLCYIDKGTMENTIDKVGNKLNELNRNTVVNFALQNLKNNFEHSDEIINAVVNRLFYTSSRLLLHGERSLVWTNVRNLNKVFKKYYKVKISISIVLLISFVSNKLSYRLAERIRKIIY
jgi:glycosyltransferase involved in cell wall biosynthesis